MVTTLVPGISHRPVSSTENIIQPVLDAAGLILRPFSNAQTSPVFQVQNVDGTDVHFGLKADGEIELSAGVGTSGQVMTSGGAGNPVTWSTPSGGDDSVAVILAPNSVNRNTIQPTANSTIGLRIKGFSADQSGDWMQCLNSVDSLRAVFTDAADYPVFAVGDDPNLSSLQGHLFAEAAGEVIACSGSGGQSTGFAAIGVVDSGTKSGRSTFNCYTRNPAAGTQLRTVFTLSGAQTQADNGELSNGSVLMLDSGFNTMLRYDIPERQWFFNGGDVASSAITSVGGETLKVGVLGAAAAPRQLLATGAGHTVDDVITVLQTFGFCKQS